MQALVDHKVQVVSRVLLDKMEIMVYQGPMVRMGIPVVPVLLADMLVVQVRDLLVVLGF